MKAFIRNRVGQIVFPSNFFPRLDFSVFDSLPQLEAVIHRDFEAKAPTGTDLLARAESGAYSGRFELLRDLALNLLWVDRFAITMYERRPTRWRDVPRRREDLFLPLLTPWVDGERKVAAIDACYRSLRPTWDATIEDQIFGMIFDVFRHRRFHATELPAIPPTVSQALAEPTRLTIQLADYDPDYPTCTFDAIVDCHHVVPELEALLRQAMVLHNQYPWPRARARLQHVGQLRPDDFVVVLHPRSDEVGEFIRRVRSGHATRPAPPAPAASVRPLAPYPALDVRERFGILPRIEALGVYRGEVECTNADLIRNSAYNWSPMSADEIRDKTGIETRRYTELGLDHTALLAARAALDKACRGPGEIGAVLFCSCTNPRLLPSMATWLSGELGIYQTHASYDLVAACAGLPYGLAEAVRLLQEVNRPVLLVCAEKFSDKIGTVRPSRMIFGDAATALVIGPAPAGTASDLEVLQTYASGPMSEVDSIIWPNPAFDNNVTVYGPEVRALAGRYLKQMINELRELPPPAGGSGSLLDSIDLIVPHQANQMMVVQLAREAGVGAERLYFNIARVGNTSAASIPLALYDAVKEGVIDRRLRVFAPGFGAGAVAGYAVLQVDPAIVAPESSANAVTIAARPVRSTSSDDARAAFGG
ncbi:MAG: ketoacyl-ACP synthase III [Chloroflexota bacterium]|nr:ketoacyl-ACP synthase III [Chloroflexota bacterium]